MKNSVFYLLLLSSSFLFLSCGKQGGDLSSRRSSRSACGRLGFDYYKMSMLELEEETGGERVYRRALYKVNQAIAQEKNPRYYAHKATLLFLLGKNEKSIEWYDKALGLPMPKEVKCEILNNYACLLANCGHYRDALSIFEKLEANHDYLTPEVAIVNQAKLYFEGGDYQYAQIKLLEAIRVAPDYIDAHYYFAVAAMRNKDLHGARRAIAKTLELEPGHSGALALRERLLKAKG